MAIMVIPPHRQIPSEVILPEQTHSHRLVEIVHGTEDLASCDGLWTRHEHFTLGIKTADCAPIVFEGKEKFGIVHAGWRGLCSGIVEKMQDIFYEDLQSVYVGSLLSSFEIQRDFCFEALHEKFGDQFFRFDSPDKITFLFQDALKSLLPQAQFDMRDTFHTPELASWRRDRDQRRNVTVVYKGHLS